MFVQRDGDGAVVGAYTVRQPGLAEEELAKDHPDVAAYRARVEAPRQPALAAEDLAEALIAKGALTRAEVEARKR